MKTTSIFYGLFGAFLLSKIANDDKAFRGHNYAVGGYSPEFHPKRTKFKGYMRENRRCTFNKNR